jgi:hypothetical protein
VIFDVTSPTSAINEITPYWHDSVLIINVVGTDETSGISSIELYYRYSANNVSWNNWALFAIDSNYPWSWNFTFQKGEGNYEFYSVATDKAGNIETKSTIAEAICAYDTGPPKIIDNTQATVATGENFTFGATVQDGIRVTSVYVLYRFGTRVAINTTLVLVSPNTYELDIQIPLNCTDRLYYTITSVDHLGKWGSTTEKTITIIDNVAPSANAGLDQTIVENTFVTLNGTGSTDNINIANYTWSFITTRSIVTLYGPNPQYNFTKPGNYTINLVVTDITGNSNNDILNITVLLDTDRDGIENIADDDDDGDGYLDPWEKLLGTNPEDENDFPTDSDGDGIPDGDATNSQPWMDTDDDGDGIPDIEDKDPLVPNVAHDGNIIDYWWVIIILIIMVSLILLLKRKKKD